MVMLLFSLLTGPALACDPVSPRSATGAALSAIMSGAWDAALASLRPGIDGLTCLAEPAKTDELVVLFQLAGYSAFQKGDFSQAGIWFNRGIVIDPDLELDPGLGASARVFYLQAQAVVRDQEAAVIVVRGDIYVDGRRRSAGQEIEVAAGEHLLQWYVDDQLHSEVRVVAPGTRSRWPASASISRASAVSLATGLGGLAMAAAGAGLFFDVSRWAAASCVDQPTYDACDAEVPKSIRGRQAAADALMIGGTALAATVLTVEVGKLAVSPLPGGIMVAGRW